MPKININDYDKLDDMEQNPNQKIKRRRKKYDDDEKSNNVGFIGFELVIGFLILSNEVFHLDVGLKPCLV